MRRYFTWFSALILFSGSVLPLEASSAARKDASAVAVVQAAITAMGGDAAVMQVKDSVVTGTISPVKDSPVKPASFTWKTLGPEFRYETRREANSYVFVSGHGKPAVSRNGQVKRVFYHAARGCPPVHLAALVLSGQLADPNYSLIDAGQSVIYGKATLKVETKPNEADQIVPLTLQTWYFDATTGLPVRVEYQIPEATNAADLTNASMDFVDFRQDGGMAVPQSILYSEGGVPLQFYAISTVTFNVGIDPSEFDLQGGEK